MKHLQNMSGADAALLCAGLATFFVAAFVLWGERWGAGVKRGKSRFSFPGIGTVSEPTRLLAGLFGIVLAYHLGVWAFPREVTPIQFPRERWWVLLVVGAGAVAGSLALDRREGSRSIGSDSEDPPGGEPPSDQSPG